MKHNNTMTELEEQMDNLNNTKQKSEKDKHGMERDLADARSNLEEGVRAKAELDRQGKLLQGQITDGHQKLDDLARYKLRSCKMSTNVYQFQGNE